MPSEPQVLELAKQLWALELPGRLSQDSEPEQRLWVPGLQRAPMPFRHGNQLRKPSR